ncbi:MAG: hypothetical protein ACKO19_00920, partial [Betaproteobacteria bacterium]
RVNQSGQVRNLLGIDPSNGTIAISGQAKAGWSLRFCTRGQQLFSQAGLEAQWVQHYLQAPVLIGFQANGEIHENQLHAYSAVMLAICDSN